MNKKFYWQVFKGLDLALIMCLILGGAMLNIYVLARNNGRMPVYTDWDYSSDKHFTTTNKSEIREFVLIDKIKFFNRIWSLGDLIMLLGIGFLFCKAFTLSIYLIKGVKFVRKNN